MSNISEQMVNMERHIERNKPLVELKELVLKLEKNREFRKLILEEFCVNECARYVQASSDPRLKPESRADALAVAQAAGHLLRWLTETKQVGTQAEKNIAEAQDEMEELRREEVE